jgi:hypothetical protein
VIYIPRWRLDAQNLLRQKNLTLQRIKALQEMVAANDLMKDDAEVVYIKYQKRLRDLEEKEKTIIELLQERLNQLDAENKNIKSVLFDAKLQYRSSELTEETYQQISIHTNDLIEHINLEKAEINNVKMRLTQQTLDNVDLAVSNTSHQKSQDSYTESSSKIETHKQNETEHIIVADDVNRTEQKAVQSNTNNNNNNNNESDENSWLNHVIQNE